MDKESPKNETKLPLLEDPDFKEFLSVRKIDPEDFQLIEKLSKFPKDLFLEFHNFFNLGKNESVSQLEAMISYEEDEQKKDFMETFLEFTKKYNWAASWNLCRLFEAR